MKEKLSRVNMAQMVLDIITLLVAALFALLRSISDMSELQVFHAFIIAVAYIFVYQVCSYLFRQYDVTTFFYYDRFLRNILRSWFITTLITTFAMYIVSPQNELRSFYLNLLATSIVLLILMISVDRIIFQMLRKKHAPKCAYVGTFKEYMKFNYFINKNSMSQDERGYILKPGQESDGLYNVLGKIEDIEQIVKDNELDVVYFIQRKNDNWPGMAEAIDKCIHTGVTTKVILRTHWSRRIADISTVGTYPIITYKKSGKN